MSNQSNHIDNILRTDENIKMWYMKFVVYIISIRLIKIQWYQSDDNINDFITYVEGILLEFQVLIGYNQSLLYSCQVI